MLERLLIVGLGSIGRRHLRLARELLPRAEIAALRHRSAASDPGVQVDCVLTTLDAAIRYRPQAAVIANPASHHLEAAMALARAGAHLLIEKPIASTERGVPELIEECRARGLALMVGYNLRFLPSLGQFRDLLAQGRVGKVLSVRAEVGQYLPSWRSDVDYRQTVSAQAALGGGALLELSHEIDYLRWLFGEVEWVKSTQRRASDLEIDVEDTVHLTLGFTDAAGTETVVAALSMDLVRHDTTRACTVIGEAGTLRWDGVAGLVQCYDKAASGWQTLFDEPAGRDASYLDEWRAFVRCIATGGQPQPSGADGLAVIRVIDAARISADSGCVARVRRDRVGGGASSAA